MKSFVFALSIIVPCVPAYSEERPVDGRPTTSLAIIDPKCAQVVEIKVSVDNVLFDEYWDGAYAALFAFADVDGNGTLDANEIRLVPSARAMRLSLGNGFTPPIASIASLKDVVDDASQGCTQEALKRYYRRNGATGVQVGLGELKHAPALDAALIQALDQDKDAAISHAELLSAENRLRSLDVNDDELIGTEEILPNCVYPGCAATNEVYESSVVEILSRPSSKSVLARLPGSEDDREALLRQCLNRIQGKPPSDEAMSVPAIAGWTISIADQMSEAQLCWGAGTHVRCEAWTVTGPLPELYRAARDRVTGRETQRPPANSDGGEPRERGNPLGWLIAMADRDRDGEVSPEELEAWLDTQRLLTHGQLLVSVMSGGGLFEMLDVNHDGGLCPRELRNGWAVLEGAACTSGESVDLGKVPSVVMIVVSQGYPGSLARTTATGGEWFRKMDRNSDGDISRREFTGSTQVFSKLDVDRDGLISPEEARQVDGQ
ncbi:MAG TPA: EF-hand domain-containing protein [Pirellulales bacterium]|nr:EF-hand domain-containing protein [Pirellulales bacterium]